jgi:hypothetical protein
MNLLKVEDACDRQEFSALFGRALTTMEVKIHNFEALWDVASRVQPYVNPITLITYVQVSACACMSSKLTHTQVDGVRFSNWVSTLNLTGERFYQQVCY